MQASILRPMQKYASILSPLSILIVGLCVLLSTYPLLANTSEKTNSVISAIDDTPKLIGLHHPDWFSETFLNLKDDLLEAKKANKLGIIIYFGQTDCAYCEALLDINFGKEKDIVKYTQERFNVIAIDIWGSREVIDFDGKTYTEREFAERHNVHFTPTLFFYLENDPATPNSTTESLRLNGFYPPYEFRGALRYIAYQYHKRESLKEYMNRADPPGKFDLGDINEQDFFIKPPYAFDRRHFNSDKPLIVFFEQRNCHACDILHSEPLNDPQVKKLLTNFEVAQLDIYSDTPTITPSGHKLTAKQWAKQLNIFYSPTLVFFDEKGSEILRVDSVVRLYRLRGVLDFIYKKGYLEAPTFQRWRENIQQQGL